jgi:hypothetical protein
MGRCSCSPRSPRSWRPTSPRPCGPQGVHRLPPAAPAVHHPDGPRLPGTALGLQHRLRPPAHLARGLHRRRVAELVRAAADLPEVAVALRPQIPAPTSRSWSSPSPPTSPTATGPAGCSWSGRRPHLAADRGLGANTRHPGRPQPGLEARRGGQGHGRGGTAGHLRPGAAAHRAAHHGPGAGPLRHARGGRGRARRCSTPAPSRWATSTAARPLWAPPTVTRGRCRRWR